MFNGEMVKTYFPLKNILDLENFWSKTKLDLEHFWSKTKLDLENFQFYFAKSLKMSCLMEKW